MQTVRTLAAELGQEAVIQRAISFHKRLESSRLWEIEIHYDSGLQTSAGMFHSKECWISLHPALTGQLASKQEYTEVFLHELAHAMQWIVYRDADHSNTWWEMMHQLGQKPVRCHSIAACRPGREKATVSLDDMGL